MNGRPSHVTAIRDALADGADGPGRFLWDAHASLSLSALQRGTILGGRRPEFAGRSVLLAIRSQLAAAAALVELDGIARRLVICPPDVSSQHLSAVTAKGGVDAIVSDWDSPGPHPLGVRLHVTCTLTIEPTDGAPADRCPTEWVLLTSGTTGAPRLVAHTLSGLTEPIRSGRRQGPDVLWGTFYDICRYGGLQIFLRAVLGHGSLVLSSPGESPGDFLSRLAAHGATHISGTPSHWRRALMSHAAGALAPRYVRLSGEIADQAVLNALRSFYPKAAVAHAYASTEAGVGFEVNDGLEGFPASLVGARGGVDIKVEDGSLRIRSARTALSYIGEEPSTLMDAEGFVDTGDIVERRGDRYYFLGRRSGVINVGGLKVYPEEVEAVLNRHPAVRMSLVRGRPSPITGSLVAADVVLKDESSADVTRELVQLCRENLGVHKTPATIRVVPALDVASAGKLARRHA